MKPATFALLLALCGVALAHSQLHLENVVCPDRKTECPNGNFCCLVAYGEYVCCPDSTPVCCQYGNYYHCCPEGIRCHTWASYTCLVRRMAIPSTDSTPPMKYNNVICHDGQSQCPEDNTCCKLASGQYGCCPLPQAVCCSDHLHCCPNGYTCDVSAGTCTKEDKVVPLVVKTPAKLKNVICPDFRSECPDGQTCCLVASGDYGCCPYPNAVCCYDFLRCCPQGYTCSFSSDTCSRGDKVIPSADKTPAMKLKNVVCPDGQSQCPDGNTCCKLASGQYGCCPLPQAVCCSDHLHCCPNGYTCDVSAGTCTKKDDVIPLFKKVSAAKAT